MGDVAFWSDVRNILTRLVRAVPGAKEPLTLHIVLEENCICHPSHYHRTQSIIACVYQLAL